MSLPSTPKASLDAQINPCKYIRNKPFHVIDADWKDSLPLSPFIPWKQAHFSVIDPYFKPNSVHYRQTNLTNRLSQLLTCTWSWNESLLSIEVEVVKFYINSFFLLGNKKTSYFFSFRKGREYMYKACTHILYTGPLYTNRQTALKKIQINNIISQLQVLELVTSKALYKFVPWVL